MARRPLRGDQLARHAAIVVASRRAEAGLVDEGLTGTQVRILDVVRVLTIRSEMPPTVREVASEVALSPSTVAYQLVQLQAKGYLRREPNIPRGLVLTGAPFGAPCAHCAGTGRAPAGDPS